MQHNGLTFTDLFTRKATQISYFFDEISVKISKWPLFVYSSNYFIAQVADWCTIICNFCSNQMPLRLINITKSYETPGHRFQSNSHEPLSIGNQNHIISVLST